VEEVPWPLLFVLRKVTSCDRGMSISMLKPRWHDLLIVVKQFVTCEGRYGHVFLYHLRLLMNFIGYPLNMLSISIVAYTKCQKCLKGRRLIVACSTMD
jgi:hypothetical protein